MNLARRPLAIRVALGLVAISLVAGVPASAATAPSASLPDIEDEVMCPICGTPLELSGSPQADRERALIRRLIAAGKSKQEIKDALVAEYGEQVLAAPESGGLRLSTWVVPGLALLLGAIGIAIGWRRARARGRRSEGDEPPLDPEYSARIDADLAREEP